MAQDVLNYELRNLYTMIVTVTDGGGLNGTATITVNILDINEKPTLSTVTREVYERRDQDTLSNEERVVDLGAVISGDDIDEGQQLTYSIIDAYPASAAFKISTSGQMTADRPTLNHEMHDQYQVTVRATDDGKIKSTGGQETQL